MIDERYLDLLQEECAEVIQACSKIKRFGQDDLFDDKTSLQKLCEEVGDLIAILMKVGIISDYDQDNHTFAWTDRAIEAKFEKLKIFGPDGSYIKSTKGE